MILSTLALFALAQTPAPDQKPEDPANKAATKKKKPASPADKKAATPSVVMQTPEPTLAEPVPIPAEIKPMPPKQPTLAQPAPAPPSLAQPSSPGGTLARPTPMPETLAKPSDAPASLAPNASAPVSLAQPRPIEAAGAAARPASQATSLAQPPPPPLALPSVTQSQSMSQSMSQALPAQPSLAQVQRPGSPASARKLSFTQHATASTSEEAPFAVKVTIRTSAAMQPVSLAITCDAEVLHGAVQTDGKTDIQGLRDGRLYQDKRIYWLVFEAPAFELRKPLTVVLMSARPIKVNAVDEGPPVR